MASEPDAEDVVQEALLRGWRSRAGCRTPGHPLGWMLTITRNEALRRVSQRPAVLTGELPDQEDPHAVAALDDLPGQLDVERALATLPEADRMLVELRYSRDLTQSAVAERLGIPEGTAKVRLHRVRQRLREQLIEA